MGKIRYTVAEYAELKGISPQAVYKQIKKNKLTGKIIIENDTTYILVDDTERLNHTQPTDNQPLNQPTNQNSHDLPLRGNNQEQPTTDNQPLNQDTTNQQPTDNQDTTTAHLYKMIEILEKQLAVKDKQIQELTECLKQENTIKIQSNTIKYLESQVNGNADEHANEVEYKTNETTTRKQHRGIFAKFRKKGIYSANSEKM